jgi:hypothetical protein
VLAKACDADSGTRQPDLGGNRQLPWYDRLRREEPTTDRTDFQQSFVFGREYKEIGRDGPGCDAEMKISKSSLKFSPSQVLR